MVRLLCGLLVLLGLCANVAPAKADLHANCIFSAMGLDHLDGHWVDSYGWVQECIEAEEGTVLRWAEVYVEQCHPGKSKCRVHSNDGWNVVAQANQGLPLGVVPEGPTIVATADNCEIIDSERAFRSSMVVKWIDADGNINSSDRLASDPSVQRFHMKCQ